MRRITPRRAISLAAATSSLAIAAAAGATAATATAAAATARSGPDRAAIAGTRPAWAIAKNEVGGGAAGAVAGSGTVTANVYLAGRDPSGLTAFSTAVSTPGNALYGHYLTAGQTMARFGPEQGGGCGGRGLAHRVRPGGDQGQRRDRRLRRGPRLAGGGGQGLRRDVRRVPRRTA